MAKNSSEILFSYLSKDIYFRKTKKNFYLLYAMGSELLSFDELTWNELVSSSSSNILDNKSFITILEDNLFFKNKYLLPLHQSKWLQVLRLFSVTFGIISIVYNLSQIANISSLSYDFRSNNFLTVLILSLSFSLLTTIMHELMHASFSNNFGNLIKNLEISIKKSLVTVDLTHVWLWPMFPRIMAVLAGLILDSTVLSALFLISVKVEHSLLTVSIYIMMIRILWQFRFVYQSDGRLLILMLLDNPFLLDDYENNIERLNFRERFIWTICRLLSLIISLSLVLLVIYFIVKSARYL